MIDDLEYFQGYVAITYMPMSTAISVALLSSPKLERQDHDHWEYPFEIDQLQYLDVEQLPIQLIDLKPGNHPIRLVPLKNANFETCT